MRSLYYHQYNDSTISYFPVNLSLPFLLLVFLFLLGALYYCCYIKYPVISLFFSSNAHDLLHVWGRLASFTSTGTNNWQWFQRDTASLWLFAFFFLILRSHNRKGYGRRRTVVMPWSNALWTHYARSAVKLRFNFEISYCCVKRTRSSFTYSDTWQLLWQGDVPGYLWIVGVVVGHDSTYWCWMECVPADWGLG